ncbi:MAG: T9SS type A sorting domain-containing protein [Bacteroidota bacterium]
MSRFESILNYCLLSLVLILPALSHAQITRHRLTYKEDAIVALANQYFGDPLIADDSLKTVVYIGRDSAISYMSPNNLEYFFSTDFGDSWNASSGPITNTNSTTWNRRASGAIYNPTNSTNPLNTSITWVSNYFSNNFFGHGLVDITTGTASPVWDSTQANGTNYNVDGVIEGAPGEFWTLFYHYTPPPTPVFDSVVLMKGTFNATNMDFDWIRHTAFPIDTGINATMRDFEHKIAFAPVGDMAWMAWLGDRQGIGADSSLMPMLRRSTDAGATWGPAIEVDLNWACLLDSLDNLGPGPAIPTTTFELDLTVDMDGNPHVAVVLANRPQGSAYNVYGGAWKGLFDITSPDSGATWRAMMISRTNALRGDWGPNFPGPQFSLDNELRIARTAGGDRIFYLWADTDASWGAGADNIAPDLHAAALNLQDSTLAPTVNFTAGNMLMDGIVFAPNMAREVLSDTAGTDTFHLPTLYHHFTDADQDEVDIFYLRGVTFDENDFTSTPIVMGAGTCGPPCGNLCVWPGDANFDYIVDMSDLLTVTLGWGNTGPARPNASLNWTGQPGIPWGTTVQGVDGMHQDCDGSNTVTWADTLAIVQNYNLTHNKSNEAFTGTDGAPALWFDPQFDSLQVGQAGTIHIMLGDSTTPVANILGLAFDVLYDPALIDTNSVHVNFDSCWIGDYQTNLAALYKDFYFQGETHIGLSRTDLTNQSGHGVIARFGIVAIDNISGKREAVSEVLNLDFANVRAIDKDGHPVTLSAISDSVIVWKEGLFVSPPVAGLDIKAWPNPVKDVLQVDLGQGQMREMVLLDAFGRELYRRTTDLRGVIAVHVHDFPAGMYFLNVSSDQGRVIQRVMVTR